MNIDAARFGEILRLQHPEPLSAVDAEVIVALAQLAVDADGREDSEEIQQFFAIGKAVFSLAGMSEASTPTFAVDEDDAQRITTLAEQLDGTASRELAYSVAFLLTVADMASAPEEDVFIESLRTALRISEDRALDLASTISAAVTPAA
ncbi:MAG: hypothetical protein M3680_22265 [Myxococcota bacterium]|nr:hypothetical protein [Myxococcota bacterium]